MPPADSPTGKALLLVANEVSQSLTIYELAVDNISINDVTVTEGNAGTTAFNFTVTRSTNTAAFSLNWATANGTAAQPSDYASASGTLNFTAGGSLTETVTVNVNGDTTPEPNETFFVNLSALTITSGIATLADAQGTGTITNDEPNTPPTGTIANQTAAAGAAFSFTPAAFTDPEAGTLTYAATGGRLAAAGMAFVQYRDPPVHGNADGCGDRSVCHQSHRHGQRHAAAFRQRHFQHHRRPSGHGHRRPRSRKATAAR